MLKLQNCILEMIATGQSLSSTATRLCMEAEKAVPGVVCSIQTVDATGRLRSLAAPSLPASFFDEMGPVIAGPDTGSCGSAAFHRKEVLVTDIETDARWASFRHLALPLGLRACWASPMLDAHNVAIGTFAFYFSSRRGPTEYEREIVRNCTSLCVIALDRHHRVIEHQRRAFTDELTSLPNRAAFEAALSGLKCDAPGDWAMLMVDLDNLKTVNDTFGHHAGDCLLKAAGERISRALSDDQAFRIGGDEFAVLLQCPDTLRDLDGTANKVLAALSEPAICGCHIVVPHATIGGAILEAGNRVPEQVRKNADFALYHAKETGRGGFVRFWPGLGTAMGRRLSNIRDVDAALREDRIDAFYQPIVRLNTREIVGLEALCRMRVGDQIVAAGSFHEATKDAHIATALTARMVEIVARDVRTWLDLGIPFQHVGINVCSTDMYHGEIERVLSVAFEKYRVPLKHVILEVTEAVYMGDGDQNVQDSIQSLRQKGLKVALDDFGTGYASLTHLLTVPVDILKIDKSFVDRLAPGDASMAIVEGLVQIAQKLGIRVVAEGIETEMQAVSLDSIGCTLGQGYLFSKAVDRNATTRLLQIQGQQLQSAAVA